MKNAVLWKRILHTGLFRQVFSEYAEPIAARIIKSPIIVDTRPAQDGQIEAPCTRRVAFPFSEMWLEWQQIAKPYPDGKPGGVGTNGALVSVRRFDGGWKAEIYPVLNTSNYGPMLVGVRKFDVGIDGIAERMRTIIASDVLGKDWCIANTDALSFTAWETLEFLSCKNVSLQPHENEPKQVRIATKRHGPSDTGYRYHTLVVRPPGAHKDSPAQEIGIMPRHVCRGHFAEYGPDFGKGLLFGRLAGRYYIPPHLKGKKENGVVEKDYVVTAASSRS